MDEINALSGIEQYGRNFVLQEASKVLYIIWLPIIMSTSRLDQDIIIKRREAHYRKPQAMASGYSLPLAVIIKVNFQCKLHVGWGFTA